MAVAAGHPIWTIPNVLTFFRIIASLALGVVFSLLDRPLADAVAFALFALASITDFFDGWLARRLNQMSELGRALDSIADKTLVFAAFVALLVSAPPVVTPWLAFAFVLITLRDFLVAGMREALGERKTALKATTMAKWKTAAQMTALSALLLAPLLGDSLRASIWHLGLGLLAVATLLTVTTGIGYVAAAFRLIAEPQSQE